MMAVSYLIKVAFPVNGPNLISPYGGWKPNILSASSWVRSCLLWNKRTVSWVAGTVQFNFFDKKNSSQSNVFYLMLWRIINWKNNLYKKSLHNIYMEDSLSAITPRQSLPRIFDHFLGSKTGMEYGVFSLVCIITLSCNTSNRK